MLKMWVKEEAWSSWVRFRASRTFVEMVGRWKWAMLSSMVADMSMARVFVEGNFEARVRVRAPDPAPMSRAMDSGVMGDRSWTSSRSLEAKREEVRPTLVAYVGAVVDHAWSAASDSVC